MFLWLIFFSKISDNFIAVFVVVDPFVKTLKLLHTAVPPISVIDFIKQHGRKGVWGVAAREKVVTTFLIVNFVRWYIVDDSFKANPRFLVTSFVFV